MKNKIFFIILILFAVNATASSLPNCPSDISVRRHYCFGPLTYSSGSKYIGEYKDHNFHGQGTYTYSDGVEQRGYHMNGEYVPTICENMGLTKGSDPFGQCVVSLINEINEDD